MPTCNYNENATDDDVCGNVRLVQVRQMEQELVDNDSDDDGVCDAIYGCTDSNYQEYDSSATDDDGSCITLMGCLDNNYYEYNADAVVDNGTCLSKIGDCNGDDLVQILTDLFLMVR